MIPIPAAINPGFGSGAGGAATPYVTVEDFARAYREKRILPSQAMEKLLQSVKELQPKRLGYGNAMGKP